MRYLLLLIVLLASRLLAAGPELWLYCQTNLLPEENIRTFEDTWRKAAAAGYTKVLLADSKFARLGDLQGNEKRYMANVAHLREVATELKLGIVPAGFGVGYSNDVLWHDPNLAEGLPVKNALFVVKGGEARLVADPPVALASKPTWFDPAYTLANGAATTRDPKGNARIVWKVKVAPYRQYHVAVKVRTNDFRGEPEIKPIADKQGLSYSKLGVKKTQDWTEHHVVFDSLDHIEVSIYMGQWGDAKGELAWKDWKIEEVGLLNVLRRDGTPCVVQGFTEGKDYEPIRDAKMGMLPWPGSYDIYHQPPVIKTRLADGTKLRVSWYFPPIIYDEQVGICPSEPKTMQLLADQAQRTRKAWEPAGMMMSHDEIRVWNQDEACLKRHLTPGQLLADNVRECGKLAGVGHNDVYVWSDMFDPYHNAKPSDYYLVNGSWEGSWEGLDKAITVVNWNFDQRDKSLRFFADRGHKQVIAGYYDGGVERIRDWMASAKGVPGVVGIMYTTWDHNYSQMERFAKIVREAAQ